MARVFSGICLLNIDGDPYWLATREDAIQGPRLTSGTSRFAVLYRAYEDPAHAQDCLPPLRQWYHGCADTMLRLTSGVEIRLEVGSETFYPLERILSSTRGMMNASTSMTSISLPQ